VVDERCKHDMAPGTCAICLGLPDDVEPDLGLIKEQRDPDSRYFVASFDGTCRFCREAIEPGQMIRRAWMTADDFDKGATAYVHEDCP